MGRKRTYFKESAWKTIHSYQYYLNMFIEIATSMFEYKNVPLSIDERYLENCLFYQGRIAFFMDDVMGVIALPFTYNSGFDIYGNPSGIEAYSQYNNYHKRLEDNYCIMYNNYNKTNSFPYIQYQAMRLYELDGTIDINVESQKTPILLQCDEKQRLTILNLFKEYIGGAPVIHGDKNLDLNESIKVVDLKAPYVADKIMELKQQIINETFDFLGVPNIDSKKERMITDEIEYICAGANSTRNSRYKARKNAVKRINEMFNTEIEVLYNTNAFTNNVKEEGELIE